MFISFEVYQQSILIWKKHQNKYQLETEYIDELINEIYNDYIVNSRGKLSFIEQRMLDPESYFKI